MILNLFSVLQGSSSILDPIKILIGLIQQFVKRCCKNRIQSASRLFATLHKIPIIPNHCLTTNQDNLIMNQCSTFHPVTSDMIIREKTQQFPMDKTNDHCQSFNTKKLTSQSQSSDCVEHVAW